MKSILFLPYGHPISVTVGLELWQTVRPQSNLPVEQELRSAQSYVNWNWCQHLLHAFLQSLIILVEKGAVFDGQLNKDTRF